MDILNKKQTELLLRKLKLVSAKIQYDGNHFEMKIECKKISKDKDKKIASHYNN